MSKTVQSKAWRRRLLDSAPVAGAIRAAERSLGPRDNDTLVVAMFHQTQTAARFGEQLDALLEGRTAVKGADVLEAVAGRGTLPPGAVWITFDDAYGDFYDIAWPVLEGRGLPATQFVATGFVGTSPATFWWDRLHAAIQHGQARSLTVPLAAGGESVMSLSSRTKVWKRVRTEVKQMPHALAMQSVEAMIQQLDAPEGVVDTRVMDWDEIRELVGRGLEVGGHTRDHPMLDQLTPKAAAVNVAAGFSDLREQVGTVLPAFAYPAGQFNADVAEAVRTCDVELALTTQNGFNRLGSVDPMRVRRVPIGSLASGTAVRLRLLLAARKSA